MWSNDNFLAWVNDSISGKPVAGAEVTLKGNYEVKLTTGYDGTVKTSYAKTPGFTNYSFESGYLGTS